MRNIFFFLGALLSFGIAFYYWQQVSARTETVAKLRLVAEDGLVIRSGTEIDEEFIERYIVSQPIPTSFAGEFDWVLDDTPVARINLMGRTLSQDLRGGDFLRREQFFVTQEDAFERRIAPGNRAFSVPVQSGRALEGFILPGAHVDVIGVFETAQDVFSPERMLENAVVMAVDGFDSVGAYEAAGSEGFSSVTLQAPAADVETFLARMQNLAGDLSLVLRNPCEEAADCAEPAPEDASALATEAPEGDAVATPTDTAAPAGVSE